jgi:hypothetical protein
MQVARRHCWAEEDRPEPLMPCADPLWLVEAPLALARLTGIDVNLIPEAEVSVFCVPIAEDDWAERGLRRWEGTRADALWHPLLWLPRRLAAPMVAVTRDGAAVEEPLERWQARVAVEIIDSGLYTDDGWVDVYALLGLSLEHRDDVARVEAWLAGQPDPLLDGFSLEPFLADDQRTADIRAGRVDQVAGPDGPAPDWSAELAAEVAPLLVSASKALTADSLQSLADDLNDPEVPLDDEAYARGAWWLAALAVQAVADDGTADAWLAILADVQAAGTDRAAIGSALGPAMQLLTAARDAHWPALSELERFAADLWPEEQTTTARVDDDAASGPAGTPVTSPHAPTANVGTLATPSADPMPASPPPFPARLPHRGQRGGLTLTAPQSHRGRPSMAGPGHSPPRPASGLQAREVAVAPRRASAGMDQ